MRSRIQQVVELNARDSDLICLTRLEMCILPDPVTCIDSLRKEISMTMEVEGWNKVSMGMMRNL